MRSGDGDRLYFALERTFRPRATRAQIALVLVAMALSAAAMAAHYYLVFRPSQVDFALASMPYEPWYLAQEEAPSIDSVVDETANEKGLLRVHQFLILFRQGVTVVEISRQLGLSREHVSRVYRKKALHLVTVKFLCLAGVRGTSGVT